MQMADEEGRAASGSAPGWGAEKRKYPRTVFRGANVLCTATDQPAVPSHNVATHLVDVSLSGACIISVNPLRPGILMNLQIRVPDRDASVKVQARVKWSRSVQHRGRLYDMSGFDFAHRPEITGRDAEALTAQLTGHQGGEDAGDPADDELAAILEMADWEFRPRGWRRQPGALKAIILAAAFAIGAGLAILLAEFLRRA